MKFYENNYINMNINKLSLKSIITLIWNIK